MSAAEVADGVRVVQLLPDQDNAAIVAQVAGWRAEYEGRRTGSGGGDIWQSWPDLPFRGGAAADLCQAAEAAVREHFDVYLLHAWGNFALRGGLNRPHEHDSADWSAVYFVQVPDGAGSLDFWHEGEIVRSVPAKVGRLVIFPGETTHSVPPNQSDMPRISIALDLVPEGRVFMRGPWPGNGEAKV